MISPITANMMILAHCFNNGNMEIRALFECDIEAEIDDDEEDATSILYEWHLVMVVPDLFMVFPRRQLEDWLDITEYMVKPRPPHYKVHPKQLKTSWHERRLGFGLFRQ